MWNQPDPTTPTAADPLLQVVEVARELRCSKGHVYNLVNGIVPAVPALPAIQMGRRKVIRRSTLERWKVAAETTAGSANVEASPDVGAVGALRSNR